MDCSHLTDITIPSGVTGIGDWAFCNCSALTGITIPNSVTDIGYGIFMGCTKLESITVPNSVTIIGDCAFQDCTSLTDITIPNKVTNITYSTFRGCTSLKNITIPSSVTSIGDCAFENCSALTGITIPGSVTSIGSSTFANCGSLTSIIIPNSVTSIGSWAFQDCTSMTDITIPSSVTSIGSCTFANCGSLTDITIPNSVTSIGSSAFYNCGGLETVIFKCAEFELGPSVFYACTALKEVHIAESMSEFPENWPDLGAAIIVLSQNCPLLTEVRERCIWYRVIETGETNVVSSSATTVKEKVADIVATVIQPGMSDYQKALVLHNWLIFNANYDYTYSNYYADGVLLKGTGVCQSYAFAYRELLNAVGIQNDFEYGFDHVWNMVLLDGEWYHVDCTWDDPNEGGWERWDFFGVTNEALTAVDNHECFNKPHIATAYRCNYNYRNGLIDSYIEDISKNVLSHVSDGEAAFNMDISSWTDVIGMRYYTALAAVRDRQLYYESKPFPAQFSVGSDHSALNVRVGVERDADFVLPKALKEIGEEAFENTDAAVVEIPDGVTSIGSEAFAYSADLRQITIPESVDSIAGNAFRGVSGLRIVGDRGSCAEDFARDAGILFVADD